MGTIELLLLLRTFWRHAAHRTHHASGHLRVSCQDLKLPVVPGLGWAAVGGLMLSISANGRWMGI